MKRRTSERVKRRGKIKQRIHKRIQGTPDRPRLSVYRSLNNITAQLVDDTNQKTLLTITSLSQPLREKSAKMKGKIEIAKMVGLAIAEEAKKKKIETVVFDRSGYLFHGRVKSLAEGAREGGLKF